MRAEHTRDPRLVAAAETVDGRTCLVFETDAGKPPLVVDDPRLLAALTMLPATFTQNDAETIWTRQGLADVAGSLWEFCLGQGLITQEPADGAAETAFGRRQAGYHGATRCYPFLDMSRRYSFREDNNLMRSYLATDGYPAVYLHRPAMDQIKLIKAPMVPTRPEGGFSMDEELALLFDGTFGERRRLAPGENADTGYYQIELIFKAIPSGGSRHPTECFVYLRTGTHPAGFYHYNVADNTLDLLADQAPIEALTKACPALATVLPAPDRPLVVVVLASRVERAMWRYRDPRSFRAIAVDVGHALQHLTEVSTWLGWNFADLAGFDGPGVASCLGTDGEAMPVLAMGVMSR